MPALALGVRKSGGELGSTMDGAEMSKVGRLDWVGLAWTYLDWDGLPQAGVAVVGHGSRGRKGAARQRPYGRHSSDVVGLIHLELV